MVVNPRTDPVALTISLLDTNWDIANVAKPTIVDRDSGERNPAPVIEVYETGKYTRPRNDGEGLFKTHHRPVGIVVWGTSRANAELLKGEVDRIYGNVQRSPDSFWNWIEDLGETPQGQYARKNWAEVIWEFWANSRPQAT